MEMIRSVLIAPLRVGLSFLFRLLGFIIKFFSNLWNILAFLCRIWLEGKIIIKKGVKIMKNSNDSLILGIDHGYGNIKTANKTFSTGVYVSDTEPAFKDNLLT